MEATKCANGCDTTGGKFVFRGGKWLCSRCMTGGVRNRAGAMFPFTSSNIGDPNLGPIEVNSLHHLRQLENRHGVASEPFNRDQSNQAEYRR